MEMGERSGGGSSKKRFRTKFSAEQKEKMLGFAEKLGWKLQRKEVDDEIERFCKSVGVTRQVFKVWMHNHKNNSNSSTNSSVNLSSLTQSWSHFLNLIRGRERCMYLIIAILKIFSSLFFLFFFFLNRGLEVMIL